jgi:hypothetical protein
MSQSKHRQLVETTEQLTREQIVAQLAPLPEEQVKYLYEQRRLEHGLGPTSSTATMRTEHNAMCSRN